MNMETMYLKDAAVAIGKSELERVKNGETGVARVVATYKQDTSRYELTFMLSGGHSVAIKSNREDRRQFASLQTVAKALSDHGIKSFHVIGC